MQKYNLSKQTILSISKFKKEPLWMLKLRFAALKNFKALSMPFGIKEISEIDFSNLQYYLKPKSNLVSSWKDLPEEIRKTYDKLKIPQTERDYLAGVAAQYESEIVYKNIQKKLEKQGVIFTSMDEGLKKYPDIVKKYFNTLVGINDNKFAALNSAVWSGGVFAYIPKNVKVDLPLQAYFRINSKQMGQFERTLIIVEEGSYLEYIEGCTAPIYSQNSLHAGVVEIFVKKNARLRYTTIQNWSKNVFNLVTKRMQIEENAFGEWIDGNIGSKLTMKYPSLYLKGKDAKGEILSLAIASSGQNQDTGGSAIHLSSNTSSRIISKSISKNGGVASFRGNITVIKNLKQIKSKMVCDSLIIDDKSKAVAIPKLNINSSDIKVSHEAIFNRIDKEQLFYLQSRGINYDQAESMLINGFIEPIVKVLPMEYAVELNRLIENELVGHR